jgi:16S rRNA (cytosine1402-N4)-methyltransferase
MSNNKADKDKLCYNYNFHQPVLLDEMISGLKPKDDEIYVDCTFGAGGYSAKILESAKCKLISFDRDSSVMKFSQPLQKKYSNFTFIHSRFSEILQKLKDLSIEKVDAIIMDLGVSSMQFDEEGRGFSFNCEAKLDMRMDQNSNDISAFEVVNNFEETELEKIIKNYGEERRAKQIAKKIVENRQQKPIEKSIQLAEIIRGVYGHRYSKTDHATKTFQAIRIFVNDELGELRLVLEQSRELLKKGGRLIVVSFHSLEDGYVKKFFKDNSKLSSSCSRYEPRITNENEFCFEVKNKATKPSDQEVKKNYRSRSSRMRIAIKN